MTEVLVILLGISLIIDQYNLYRATRRIDAIEKRIDELERIVWRLE